MAVSGEDARGLHMLCFPYMAPGHMIPMVDMAKLFAGRGARVTILTTPANAPLVQPAIDAFNLRCSSGELLRRGQIAIELIPFPPSSATGLPDGCENAMSLLARNQGTRELFMKATDMLRDPFAGALARLRPDAVVSDFFLPWTLGAAAELGIPRLVFDGCGFFPECASRSVLDLKPQEPGSSPAAAVVVLPGLPHRIEMLRSQITKRDPWFDKAILEMDASSAASYGTVVNSFYELEPEYAEHFRDVLGRRAWHVGPMCLCNVRDDHPTEEEEDEFSGGGGALREWMDGKAAGSVLYACFGSMTRFSDAQMREIAAGIEASGHSFIWVVKKKTGGGGGEEWLPEGFEERIGERGLIVRGWAPQTATLNHPAVGGFMTHCGWNSTVEAVSSGVPMATWPTWAEQFYNERLIVDVLRVGVAVGVDEYGKGLDGVGIGGVVAAKEVQRAIRRVMGGGEEAEGMRERAAALGMAARAAVDVGGSSHRDLGKLFRSLLKKDGEEDAELPAN